LQTLTSFPTRRSSDLCRRLGYGPIALDCEAPNAHSPPSAAARTIMSSMFSWDYDRTELLADGIVHVLGVIIAVAAAAVLIVIARSEEHTSELQSLTNI